MHILILIPAFLIFLYVIYKIVKDDYIFIRRNISLEQVFDIVFIIALICLIFSRFSFAEGVIGRRSKKHRKFLIIKLCKYRQSVLLLL